MKLRKTIVLACAALALATYAQAAMSFKGVLDVEGTITFYYDDVDHSSEGTVRTHTAGSTGLSPWRGDAAIVKAVFTPSCSSLAWTTGLQYFFLNCSNMTSVVGLSNVNAAGATSFYEMFRGCSSLGDLDFETMESGKVTNFGEMFYGCSSLTNLDISSLSSASATSCGSMFRSCPKLTTIYASEGLDFSGLASQWVFTGSSKIVGGNGTKSSSGEVHASRARIDTAETPGYFTLKTVSLTIAASEFAAKHIASVEVTKAGDGSVVDPDEVGGNIWTLPAGRAVTITYTAEDGYEFVGETTYADTRFSTRGVFRDEVVEGEESPTFAAASRCVLTISTDDFASQHVASVVVKDTNTGSPIQPEQDGTYSLAPGRGFTIVYIAESGYFFANYISRTNDITYVASGVNSDTTITTVPSAPNLLSSVQIKGVVPDSDPTTMTLYLDNVSHEGTVYARKAATGFPSWSNLSTIRRVVIDSSLRTGGFGSNGDGFQYLFYKLSSVTNIEGLSNLKTDKATNFTEMFYECSSLESLDISSFRTPLVKHFGEMFRYCSSLKTIDMSRCTCPAAVGCAYMFNGCTSLTTVYVRADFDFKDVSNDDYMFTSCGKLVGGNGTKVTSGLQHYRTYAHADVPGNPGYFTLKPLKGCCLFFR